MTCNFFTCITKIR